MLKYCLLHEAYPDLPINVIIWSIHPVIVQQKDKYTCCSSKGENVLPFPTQNQICHVDGGVLFPSSVPEPS